MEMREKSKKLAMDVTDTKTSYEAGTEMLTKNGGAKLKGNEKPKVIMEQTQQEIQDFRQENNLKHIKEELNKTNPTSKLGTLRYA